jgi:hypothetical protein
MKAHCEYGETSEFSISLGGGKRVFQTVKMKLEPHFDWIRSKNNGDNMKLVHDDIEWTVFRSSNGFFRVVYRAPVDNIMPTYISAEFRTQRAAMELVETFITQLPAPPRKEDISIETAHEMFWVG